MRKGKMGTKGGGWIHSWDGTREEDGGGGVETHGLLYNLGKT